MISREAPVDQLLQLAKASLARLDEERSGKVDDWVECGLAWQSKFGRGWKGVKNYRSQRYLAYPFSVTNAVVSAYLNALMPHDDYFTMYGRTPERDSAAKLAAELIKWGHYKTGFRNAIREIMTYAAIYGNAPVRRDWHQSSIHRPDYQSMAKQRGEKYAAIVKAHEDKGMKPPSAHEVPILVDTIQQKEVDWEATITQVGSIFDYWQDRWHRGETYPLRIVRSVKSKSYLGMLAEPDSNGYAIYEDIDELNEGDVETTGADQSMRHLHSRNNWNDQPTLGIELHEFWGDFEVDIDGEKQVFPNHVLVMANNQKIIRFEPNPYDHGMPPWSMWVWHPIPGETYGYGLLEPILPLNDALQVRWNQEIEARGLEVQPIFEVKVGGILDIDAIRVYPGALYPSLDGNSIRKIDMGNSANGAMEEINFIMGQINEITGATRAFSAAGGPASATEVSAISNKDNAISSERVRYIEDTLLIPNLRVELGLYQQYLDKEIAIRILNPMGGEFRDPETGLVPQGPPFLQIMPKDIRGEFDFVVMGAGWLANRQNMAQAMQSVTLPILQNPTLSGWIKPPEFITTVYQGFGIRDAWKFVMTKEEKYAEQLAQAPVPGQPGGPNFGGPGGPAGPEEVPPDGGAPSMAGVPGGPVGPPPTVDPGQLAGPQLPT